MTTPVRYRIILSKRVAVDLQGIFDHIAKDSVANAAGMVERILDAIALLDTFPHRNIVEGQSPKIKESVRSLPVKPYMIFFQVDDKKTVVRILRVRHGARRRPRRF